MSRQQNPVKNFNIIVMKDDKNKTTEAYLKIRHWLSLQSDLLVTAMHNEDVKEDGSPKLKHYHMVVTLDHRTRKETLLKYMQCSALEDLTGVQVEECKNVKASIRYLIHLDDVDKHQYDSEIVDVAVGSKEFVKSCFNLNFEIDEDDFIKVVEDCTKSTYFDAKLYIKTLGLGRALRYAPLARMVEDQKRLNCHWTMDEINHER